MTFASAGNASVKREKTEELSDAERIARRIAWLNTRGGLQTQVDSESVLPALDCIGVRRSMRVLQQLQDNASNIEDPEEFIREQVGRSGWIWAKSEIVDDDEKVAKRVAWLNLFGGLQQPIDYSKVAELLDELKVAHAMVLLRELEVQAHKVPDPTAWIKECIRLSGVDDIELPPPDENSSTVGRRVAELNASGSLNAPIDFAELGKDLELLGEESGLQILQDVADKGSSVKDPTGYLRFKIKARQASLGASLEIPEDDETKILKRVEWLNDFGGLLADIDYNRTAATLEALGVEHAMMLLKEVEDQRGSIADPTSFIINSAKSSWKRAAGISGRPQAVASKAAPEGPTAGPRADGMATEDLSIANDFLLFLNKPGTRRGGWPVRLIDIVPALDVLGPRRSLRALREMREGGLGMDDPVSYLKAASAALQPESQRVANDEGTAASGGDDVAKITGRLNWLNQFGGLPVKIHADEVIGGLYCLGVPQSMAILRGLHERAATVPDPTRYIKTAVHRANMASVVKEEDLPPPEEEVADEEPAQEEEEDVDDVGLWNSRAWTAAKDEDWGEEGGTGDEQWGDEQWEAAGSSLTLLKEPRVQKASAKAEAARVAAREAVKRRIVGTVTGYRKCVPARPAYVPPKLEAEEQEPPDGLEEPLPAGESQPAAAERNSGGQFLTPTEKLVQVRNVALKHGLHLNEPALKSLARLPFHKSKDIIDDVVLGGRNRSGVTNPSRYIMNQVERMSIGLGVEQGIAMELAVSLGVVLNNDALDELACIPRKESHSIIRELSSNPQARSDPLSIIRAEVLKCRARKEARPFPGSE